MRNYLTKTPVQLQMGLLFFMYTLLTGLAIQLVILPSLIPGMHAGSGLLLGSDSVTYHELALRLAQDIGSYGWGAWQLRPDNNIMVGILSVFYVVIAPEPWTILPLNALLHALAGVLFYQIIDAVAENKKTAFLATIPFVIFPSALLWTSQILKDGFFIAGNMAIIWGFIAASRIRGEEKSLCAWLNPMFSIYAGLFLVWLVRPYGLQFILVSGLAAWLIIALAVIVRIRRKEQPPVQGIAVVALTLAILVSGVQILETLNNGGYSDETSPGSTVVIQNPQYDSTSSEQLPSCLRPIVNYADGKIHTLAVIRDNFTRSYPGAGTNIDLEEKFTSLPEYVSYVPRATVIGLLAPFPNTWFSEGSSVSSKVSRGLTSLEMILLYISYPLVVLGIYSWRRRPETWIMLIMCLPTITLFASIICNVGAIYRIRYGYVMLISAIGFAVLITWIYNRRLPFKQFIKLIEARTMSRLQV